MEYRSSFQVASQRAPDVTYTIRRVSFGRRLELLKKIRGLSGKLEFLRAGMNTPEKMEAAEIEREVEAIYIQWGLEAVDGLVIDGAPAVPSSLLESGPEEMVQEVLEHLKEQIGLTDDERKN